MTGGSASQRRREGAAPQPPGVEDLTPEDYAAALEELRQALRREEESSSGQRAGFEAPPPERRGAPAAVPIDDFSFFSRDPVVSLLQSALEEYLETFHAGDLVSEGATDDRRGGRGGDVAVTDIVLRGWEPTRTDDARRLFGRFEPADVRWIGSVVAMGIRRLRGRRRFSPSPAATVELSEKPRLVLVGDWGSGLPRARKVGEQIRGVLEEGRKARREQHLVHLGDVYYSGWAREYDKRFLAGWPVDRGSPGDVGSWSLNGNHDMYSGGHDYFDHLLADPRFARQERSSIFRLRTPRWEILGLDTAWEDGGLVDPQAEWVGSVIGESQRKLMLLSHHQLFSAYEDGKPRIEQKLRGVLDTGRVRAWFWGHEHRCMLYAPHGGVAHGRCLGHGGVPVYMFHDPGGPSPPPGTYEYRAYLQSGIERWALFGFAVLDFDGDDVDVRYIDEDGREHHRERIG